MKKLSRSVNLLPIPIFGCFFAPENWQTLLFMTTRLWINQNAVNCLLQVIKVVDQDCFNWPQFLLQLCSRTNLTVFSSIFLLIYIGEGLVDQHTLPFTIVFCLYRLFAMEEKEEKTIKKNFIGYGVGMACSFFEGYLAYILPNHGTRCLGLEETISVFESSNRVAFPVKKLFLVITKSLHCPPSLMDFNKPDKTKFSILEGCKSLVKQTRNVAGVKDRQYKNSAYMILRPGANRPPVFLAAESATPLLTLHKVKERRAVYKELADADFDLIVSEFCFMLESILENSRECHRKCVLVHFDDTDPTQNLADVLLQKIEEIEPNFEELMKVENLF